MARADEPRVSVRLSRLEFIRLKAMADACDSPVGLVLREAAMRHGAETAQEIWRERLSGGPVRLRRRSVPVPVRAPAADPLSE